MIFRHSLKTLIRTPLKTLLFFLLIAVVTCSSTLGISMFSSSQNMLYAANEQYKTVAQLEYIGADYPTYSEYDPLLSRAVEKFDFNGLKNLPYVESFERNIPLHGYIPGRSNKITQSIYKDAGVIVFRVDAVKQSKVKQEIYREDIDETVTMEVDGPVEISAIVLASPYNFNYDFSDTYFITINNEDPYTIDNVNEPMYKPGRVYIANGKLKEIQKTIFFEPCDFDSKLISDLEMNNYMQLWSSDSTEIARMRKYGHGIFSLYPYVYDITSYWDSEDTPLDMLEIHRENWQNGKYPSWQDVFLQVADTYEVVNNSMDVIAVDDCSKAPNFLRGDTGLEDGRFYEPEDGDNVVVISQYLANAMGVGVGDTIELDLHCTQGEAGPYESYFPTHGFLNSDNNQYTITGIFTYKENTDAHIFIPMSGVMPHFEGEDAFEAPLSYQLANFTIENGHAVDFENAVNEILPTGMKISVYDQGYGYVERTFTSMRDTSIMILAGSLVVGVSILLLFAYLFVTKQKDSMDTILRLGGGEARGYAYLTLGVLVMTLLAAAIGAFAGYMLSGNVLTLAYETASAKALNTAYSAVYSRPESVENLLVLTPSIVMTLISFGVVALTANLLCALFAYRALVGEREDESKTPAAARRRFNHSFKHAFRSMRRNVGRSLIVPAVSLFITALLLVYGAVLTDYDNKIVELYDTTDVSGNFISLNGRFNDGLLLDGGILETVWESGAIDTVNASFSARYEYRGISEYADGTVPENVDELFKIKPITTSFQAEEESYRIKTTWSTMTYTSDLETLPELEQYDPVVLFMDGYDETVLQRNEDVCVIPFSLAEKKGIKFGDTICLAFVQDSMGWPYCWTQTYKVVGYYTASGESVSLSNTVRDERIYAPLICGLYQSYLNNPDNWTDRFALTEWSSYKYDEDTGEVYYQTYSSYNISYEGLMGENASMLVDAMQSDDTAPYSYMPRLNSIRFTLKKGVGVLRSFKSYLSKQGLSSQKTMSRIRYAVVIDDNALIQSVDAAQKIIDYMRILYPVLFALIVAIAFVVSYLLTHTRRDELAIMRSGGAGRIKTFFAFFIEQVTLCIVGTVIGALALWAILGVLTLSQVISILIYFGCYVIGVSLACLVMSRGSVLKLLSSNE